MGFSEKASCRPYKNCYEGKTGSNGQDMISNLVSLIPPPPPIEDLFKELPHVMFQYENRFNSELEQDSLDFQFWNLFDDVLLREGYDSKAEELEEISESLVPLIYDLKDYYNTVRPDELASMKGISFRADFLKTAQTPSYPSGHTTQAFYLAHTLSEEFPLLSSQFFKIANKIAESRIDRGVHFFSDNEGGKALAKVLFERKRNKYGAKRDDSKLKNTGHGGLDTWFAGHGGGKPDERATWGDWIAITPIKHTIKKKNGEPKTYDAGDIVGLCAISSEPQWKSVTDDGKNPLKCMPRDKAYDLTKEQRATLARKKRREESKAKDGQKPVLTPTFSEKGKEMIKKKANNPLDINFEGTGNVKLDLAIALTYENQDGLIQLLPKGFIDECKAEIMADTHAMFQKKRNVSPERQLDNYIDHIIPHSQWSYQWESDFPRLNIFHEEWGKDQSLGKPPLPNLKKLVIGGEFKVNIEGANPHITGIVSVIFSILYVVVRNGSKVRILPKKETFQMDFPVEINLRNSESFNSLYFMWLEGRFR